MMRGLLLTISLTLLSVQSFAASGTVKLNIPASQRMALYDGPTTTSTKGHRVPGGAKLKLLGPKQGEWYWVEYKTLFGGTKKGWMYDGSNNYLQEVASSVSSTRRSSAKRASSASTHHVSGTRTCLFLRPRASSKSGDLGCLINGTPITKTGNKRNGFYPVRLSDGRTGWMGSRYLKQGRGTSTEASTCVDCDTRQRTNNNRITVGRGAFRNYHKNSKVAGMIAQCKRRYGRRRSRKYCLKGVRLSGQASGLFKKGRNLTSWGSTAGQELKRQGFINLLKDSSYRITSPNDPDIPIGAILTYDGRNGRGRRTVPLGKGIGHAEMKTAQGRFCSDFTTSVPGGAGKIRGNSMQGGTGRRTRRLKGVWVKPGL